MTEIVYAGIPQKYIDELKGELIDGNSILTPAPVDNIEGTLFNQEKHALLIGEETINPIRLAQNAYAVDKCISILIIAEPDHYNSLKNALMFTPFIGSTVSCVSDGSGKELGIVVNDLVEKTKQRRKYSSFKKLPIPAPSLPTVEQLKREYINHFFDKAPVGALLLNEDHSILALNTYASLIFEKEETELIDKIFYDLFPKKIKDKVKRVLTEKDKGETKKTFLYSNSPIKYIQLSISEVRLRGSNNYKTVLINDITDKVLKDQRIENQVDELKKVNNDLDNFVYTASHDLKAPIANLESIISVFKNYTKEKLDDKERKLVELIDLSINRFKNTIKDLTEISKLQIISDDMGKVNFSDTLEEVVTNIRQQIVESEAEIKSELLVSDIYYSKKDLNSIIYNLISNAIKYRSPERKPEILVKTEKVGRRVVLSVQDNGLGMDPRYKEKIFSMFKRLHKHVEGSGIGLYIVKKMVENHGGKIEVESEVGKGSIFKVFLSY